MDRDIECGGDDEAIQVAGVIGHDDVRTVRIKVFMTAYRERREAAGEQGARAPVCHLAPAMLGRREHHQHPGKHAQHDEHRPGVQGVQPFPGSVPGFRRRAVRLSK